VRYWEQAEGKRRSFEAPYTVEADSASEAFARAKDRFDELDRHTSASESRGIEAIEVVFQSSGDPSRWLLDAREGRSPRSSTVAAPGRDEPSPAARRRRCTDV
jgi:hypothetical protein